MYLMHIYHGILFIKEGNSAICDMDELGGHYAKWNKPYTESQIWYELVYI